MFSTTKSIFRKLPAFKTNFVRLKPLSRRVSSKPYVDKYKPVSDNVHLLTVQLVRTILRPHMPLSPRIANGIGHIVWGTYTVVKNIMFIMLPIFALVPITHAWMWLQGKVVFALVPPKSPEQLAKELAKRKADPEYEANKQEFVDFMVYAANCPWR